jgi:hypothetical protein
MNTPSRFWRITAVIFVFLNIGGALLAIRMGEQMHAEGHLALLLLTFVAYLVMRGSPGPQQQHAPPAELADPRIEHLQRSVDAIALEVERMGEAQRFREKLDAQREDEPGE